MTDLERELRKLAETDYLPPAPDVADRIHARIERERPRVPVRRRRLGRRIPRALVPALGFTVLLAATAIAATPSLRHEIGRLLGLRGVEIHRAPLPKVPPRRNLHLGTPVTLAAASRSAGFHVLVPSYPGLRTPDRVYLARGFPSPGGQVTLAYGPRPGFPQRRLTGVGLLLSEFKARSLPYMDKTVEGASTVVPVRIGSSRGFWLAGAPHVQVYLDKYGNSRPDTMRLATNTLVWERGPLTLRLEGAGSQRLALAVARSLR